MDEIFQEEENYIKHPEMMKNKKKRKKSQHTSDFTFGHLYVSYVP